MKKLFGHGMLLVKERALGNLKKMRLKLKKGFLLNHLIKELLPAKGDGQRWSNSDPITGQAAWFDLKVKIEKADPDEPAEASPQFPSLPRMNGVVPEPDKTLRYGLQWTKGNDNFPGGAKK